MGKTLQELGIPMKGMSAAESEAIEKAALRGRTFEAWGIPMKPGEAAAPVRSFASLGIRTKSTTDHATRIAAALRSETSGLREHTYRSASGAFTVVGD